MKIFLCWSRGRSEKLADALKQWMLGVVPGLGKGDVFYSPEIEKGSGWFAQVSEWLAQAQAAVICLTPENADSAWMHFEAGVVLGRVRKERVFPYLLGPQVLQGPLAAFQSTVNSEEDTRRLAERLCRLAKAELPADYGEHWARLRGRMNELKPERLSDVVPRFAELFQRKTFNEPLKECTDQTWADRYAGARETKKVLEQWKEEVSRVCDPRQRELFNSLLGAVDGYAGLLKKHLLIERQFYTITEPAQVDFTRTAKGTPYRAGEPILSTAESRVKQIKDLVRQLDNPGAEDSPT